MTPAPFSVCKVWTFGLALWRSSRPNLPLPPPRVHLSKYLVRASYLQIYNEVISDLLKPEKTNLVIREDRKRGVFVDGLPCPRTTDSCC